MITIIQTNTITSPITPAKRVRYHRGDRDDAILAAARVSMADGQDYMVHAVYGGFKVEPYTPNRVMWGRYFVVSGKTVTLYEIES